MMKRSVLAALMSGVLYIAAQSAVVGDAPIFDETAAREYCDRNMLDRVEGIWKFPEDETVVMIRRSDLKDGKYDITVVETPDCRLSAGERIGELTASTDADKYRLSLFAHKKDDLLTDSRECLAELSGKGDALCVSRKKYRISLRGISFLPKFWRLVKISVDNPIDRLPEGLVRVYPSYDGNSSDRSRVRSL